MIAIGAIVSKLEYGYNTGHQDNKDENVNTIQYKPFAINLMQRLEWGSNVLYSTAFSICLTLF